MKTTMHRWPVAASLLVAAIFSAAAALALSQLVIDGSIYDLLAPDDPVAAEFNSLARQTPGLEELLVVCEPESPLRNTLVDELSRIPGTDSHTRTYVRPGLSSVYAFALAVDPAAWRATQPVLNEFRRMLAESGAECGLTGTPAVVLETQMNINTDLSLALILAAGLVVLMFGFVYRISWLALFMLVPVLLGIAWGLAVFSFTRGEVTLLAAMIPTLLIGIGIDHSIHLIQATRYRLVQGGLDRDAAILAAWRKLFRPISVATLTTAAAFAALTTADLKGLADLGWAGLFVTAGVYVSCLLLVPVVLTWSQEKWLTRPTVLSNHLSWLVPKIRAHKIPIFAAFLVIVLAAAALTTRVEFLDDNRKLQGTDLESLILQDRIAEEHELNSSPLLLRFDEPFDAIELQADADRPDVVATILSMDAVPGLLQIHTRDNPFVARNYRPIIAEIETWIETLQLGPYTVNGAPRLNARVDEVIQDDVRTVPAFAALLVLAVLVVGTRSIVRPLAVLIPLVAAMLFLGGAMSLMGVPASVVTVAALPLIIGIGVDGGVHMLASWRRHDGRMETVFADTGLAIVVTVITSSLAFSAFLFVSSPAMVQFGSQVTVAMAGILAGTIVVLPILLSLRRKDSTDNA